MLKKSRPINRGIGRHFISFDSFDILPLKKGDEGSNKYGEQPN